MTAAERPWPGFADGRRGGVTHDVDEAIALADRVVVLEGGKLAADLHTPPKHSPTGETEAAARDILKRR